jgi:hypothetical protein
VQGAVEEVLGRLAVQPVRLLVGVGDPDELQERQAIRVRVLAVLLDPAPEAGDRLLGHEVAVVGQRGVDVVPGRAEVPGLDRSPARDPDRRVRALQRPGQDVHVAHLGEPAVEGERFGRGPRLEDQVDAFEVLLAEVPGVDAVGVGGVHGRADGEAADEAAVRQQVDHGHLLGHPHGRVVERDRVAQDGDGGP